MFPSNSIIWPLCFWIKSVMTLWSSVWSRDLKSSLFSTVIIVACDGLVDEVSVELDVVLVELEEAGVELDDVEDDSLVF